MWKSVYFARKIQCGVTKTSLEINLNIHCTKKYKQSELELGIIDTNIKRFLLKYLTPLMDIRPIHKVFENCRTQP